MIYSFYQLVPSANTKLTSWLTGKQLTTMWYAQYGASCTSISISLFTTQRNIPLKYYFKSKDKITLKTNTIVTTVTI